MTKETPSSHNFSIEELIDQFSKGSERKRKSLIPLLESRAKEIAEFGSIALSSFDPAGDDWGAGWILQLLNRYSGQVIESLIANNSSGWFTSPSSREIDYEPFQEFLLKEDFEEADRFTSATLRKLAGVEAENRGYVYFTEVDSIPVLDLTTIDRLWKVYSQGKFGFTRQAKLLKALDGNYERLWPRIGWKKDGIWTRYPSAFTWSLEAPDGHMPLVNQLRGVRLMHALLNHPAYSSERSE